MGFCRLVAGRGEKGLRTAKCGMGFVDPNFNVAKNVIRLHRRSAVGGFHTDLSLIVISVKMS